MAAYIFFLKEHVSNKTKLWSYHVEVHLLNYYANILLFIMMHTDKTFFFISMSEIHNNITKNTLPTISLFSTSVIKSA